MIETRRSFLKAACGLFLPAVIPFRVLEPVLKFRYPFERRLNIKGVDDGFIISSTIGKGCDYPDIETWGMAWSQACHLDLTKAGRGARAIFITPGERALVPWERAYGEGMGCFGPAEGWITDDEHRVILGMDLENRR